MMRKDERWLREFDIPFVGMKLGVHQFEYDLTDDFFSHYPEQEFRNPRLKSLVNFEKKTNMLLIDFKVSGVVEVDCDISTEPFDLEINGVWHLVVKFGVENTPEEDGVMTLKHEEHTINISQFIYETAVLAVPLQKIHPGVKDGSLDNEVLRRLAELRVETLPGEPQAEPDNAHDPRWDKLKDLYNKLN
ncbi:YceD family protein [Schleiferia thermophila]|jgi:uncharacterized metal-binding protein YceD (DUF177 family)|uniref:YceD family protein n=2 Tax=Schleiferia thermophila TaxID=884107 RepID=UPI00068C2232|nr:DUF177 domain-containing protein [Schleiferia thermophila]PMB17765.1 hypothetical protein CEN47_25380 [Fischerella thermalis CCMEE 5319]